MRFPEHAAVDETHHVEGGAGHALVGAKAERLGHRKALRIKRADHAVLAVDRVRGRQQLARRLAPQHIAPRRRLQQIGRVRLPALELLQRQRAGKAADLAGEILREPRLIELERGRRLLGAGKRLLAVYLRHVSARILARCGD